MDYFNTYIDDPTVGARTRALSDDPEVRALEEERNRIQDELSRTRRRKYPRSGGGGYQPVYTQDVLESGYFNECPGSGGQAALYGKGLQHRRSSKGIRTRRPLLCRTVPGGRLVNPVKAGWTEAAKWGKAKSVGGFSDALFAQRGVLYRNDTTGDWSSWGAENAYWLAGGAAILSIVALAMVFFKK